MEDCIDQNGILAQKPFSNTGRQTCTVCKYFVDAYT